VSIHSNERWLPIAGFEDYYEVSDQGRVRATFKVMRKKPPPRILGDRLKANGRMPYWQVTLCPPYGRERGRFRHALIHQLVLETFVGPAPQGTQCRHLDGNPDNNAVANLTWGTASENQADRWRHGTRCVGESHGGHKLTVGEVLEIRRLASTTNLTQKAIGTRFGIGQATAGRIIRRLNWTEI
jgi:hypothetical protein